MQEDGTKCSFAGQYDTYLNLSPEEVSEAVERCIRSTDRARAKSYLAREGQSSSHVRRQRMVPARVAGVLSQPIRSPVRGTIDVIQGLGESLVNGTRTPIITNATERANRKKSVSTVKLPDDAQLESMVERRFSPKRHSTCLSTWNGRWIQKAKSGGYKPARSLRCLAIRPSSIATDRPRRTSTRCNIGEMMPGAVAPLSLDFTARGIEVGMQRMYITTGLPERPKTGSL